MAFLSLQNICEYAVAWDANLETGSFAKLASIERFEFLQMWSLKMCEFCFGRGREP